MAADLEKLAEIYGIAPSYDNERGNRVDIGDDVKRALLHAMGVDADDPQALKKELRAAPPPAAESDIAKARACFMPDWLYDGRCWGISCQVYGLLSERSQRIGDFEDLARLAEFAATLGADFVGTNPLHALFASEPERASPYSPSSRRFLNPLYIALDPLSKPIAPKSDLIDYTTVAGHKRKVLEVLFKKREPDDAAYLRFAKEHGVALEAFATFEALSEAMVAQGHGSGWLSWPEQFHDCRGEAVRAFAEENRARIAFHAWLQWLATSQLAEAQKRARAAGMRIGLYLDLAVGVAPDGMETWFDPEVAVAGARIGAPPDLFNAAGQDWGLAPLSPAILRSRDLEPFVRDLEASMRHAGAARLDHVMALQRLFWIPGEAKPTGGGYILYPFEEMLAKLADVSHATEAIVIGEDLGTVPEGFRERMRTAEVQSYRLMLFERDKNGAYLPADAYPKEALACLATHDLPAFAGWWIGHDIDLRTTAALITPEVEARSRQERIDERKRLLDVLQEAHLLAKAQVAEALAGTEVPDYVVAAAHVFVARAPSRLMVAQLEDLVGATTQTNLPGTDKEHANWRRVLGIPLEELGTHPLLQVVAQAIAKERPRDA